MRPMLLPHLRPLWRDRSTVQLGVDPAGALMLEFTEPATARLVELLDGSRTEREIILAAQRRGIDPTEARQVLRLLADAGVLIAAHALLPRGVPETARRRLHAEAAALARRASEHPRHPADRDGGARASGPASAAQTPAQLLRQRATARVLIAGAGALADPIAEALCAAGIGTVTRDAPARAGRGATLAVSVAAAAPAALTAHTFALRRLPHLAVTLRGGVAVIGPLVPAGGSPCLACLELHRRDRDPVWPALAAQLATGGESPCDVATALAASGYAVAEILAFIDGRPVRTLGVTVEIAGPGHERRRRWSPHPGCDCSRRRHRANMVVGGESAR